MATVDELLERARAAHQEGRVRDALLSYREAADLARSAGMAVALVHALRHVSELGRQSGEPGSALAAAHEALGVARSLPGPPALELANVLRITALAREADGDRDTQALWREARDLYGVAGASTGVAECDRRLASTAPASPHPPAA